MLAAAGEVGLAVGRGRSGETTKLLTSAPSARTSAMSWARSPSCQHVYAKWDRGTRLAMSVTVSLGGEAEAGTKRPAAIQSTTTSPGSTCWVRPQNDHQS